MLEKIRSQTDLLLLLSVLLVIVTYPLLDHDDLRRLILAALIFVPVLLATIRLSKKRGWLWPSGEPGSLQAAKRPMYGKRTRIL
jgi:integral membrane sensor domain MASE1